MRRSVSRGGRHAHGGTATATRRGTLAATPGAWRAALRQRLASCGSGLGAGGAGRRRSRRRSPVRRSPVAPVRRVGRSAPAGAGVSTIGCGGVGASTSLSISGVARHEVVGQAQRRAVADVAHRLARVAVRAARSGSGPSSARASRAPCSRAAARSRSPGARAARPCRAASRSGSAAPCARSALCPAAAFSFSSETFSATRPNSSAPSSRIQPRPRTRRSSSVESCSERPARSTRRLIAPRGGTGSGVATARAVAACAVARRPRRPGHPAMGPDGLATRGAPRRRARRRSVAGRARARARRCLRGWSHRPSPSIFGAGPAEPSPPSGKLQRRAQAARLGARVAGHLARRSGAPRGG